MGSPLVSASVCQWVNVEHSYPCGFLASVRPWYRTDKGPISITDGEDFAPRVVKATRKWPETLPAERTLHHPAAPGRTAAAGGTAGVHGTPRTPTLPPPCQPAAPGRRQLQPPRSPAVGTGRRPPPHRLPPQGPPPAARRPPAPAAARRLHPPPATRRLQPPPAARHPPGAGAGSGCQSNHSDIGSARNHPSVRGRGGMPTVTTHCKFGSREFTYHPVSWKLRVCAIRCPSFLCVSGSFRASLLTWGDVELTQRVACQHARHPQGSRGGRSKAKSDQSGVKIMKRLVRVQNISRVEHARQSRSRLRHGDAARAEA